MWGTLKVVFHMGFRYCMPSCSIGKLTAAKGFHGWSSACGQRFHHLKDHILYLLVQGSRKTFIVLLSLFFSFERDVQSELSNSFVLWSNIIFVHLLIFIQEQLCTSRTS